MRTLHSPRQVMALTQPELDLFVGRCVVVADVDSRWWTVMGAESVVSEGISGDICTAAVHAGDPHRMADETITIRWQYGDERCVILGQPVFLLVCDEHGDHRNEDGRECLLRLFEEIPTITDRAEVR